MSILLLLTVEAFRTDVPCPERAGRVLNRRCGVREGLNACHSDRIVFRWKYIQRLTNKPIKLDVVSLVWVNFAGSELREFQQLLDLEAGRGVALSAWEHQ